MPRRSLVWGIKRVNEPAGARTDTRANLRASRGTRLGVGIRRVLMSSRTDYSLARKKGPPHQETHWGAETDHSPTGIILTLLLKYNFPGTARNRLVLLASNVSRL
jgi:hypothetical protein